MSRTLICQHHVNNYLINERKSLLHVQFKMFLFIIYLVHYFIHWTNGYQHSSSPPHTSLFTAHLPWCSFVHPPPMWKNNKGTLKTTLWKQTIKKKKNHKCVQLSSSIIHWRPLTSATPGKARPSFHFLEEWKMQRTIPLRAASVRPICWWWWWWWWCCGSLSPGPCGKQQPILQVVYTGQCRVYPLCLRRECI